MRPYSFVHSAALSIAASLGLAVATALPAWSADFSDRDLLEDVLTLDEQASLADAEESAAEAEAELADAEAELAAAQDQLDAASMDLADAQAELMDAQAAASDAADAVAQAQMDVDTAQALLDQGIVDGLPQPELDLLEAAVANQQDLLDAAAQDAVDADAAVDAAAMAVSDAQTDESGAQMAIQDAEDAVDAAQMSFDDANAVVVVILGDIEATETFVSELDDRQVFALNRSLHPAVATGLVPLEIPLDLLYRIIDEDLGDGEIQALTRGFRLEERFDRKADAFEDQGKDFQAAMFRDRADEALARNLARVDGPPGQAKKAAQEAAEEAAQEALDDATGGPGNGNGFGPGGQGNGHAHGLNH